MSESVYSPHCPHATSVSADRSVRQPGDPLAPYEAVLLLSYGGPRQMQDVLPFMRNATAGRGVPDARLLEVSKHYGRFDGVSPINARNEELLEALRAQLRRCGSKVPIAIGNRNWHPFVSEALRTLANTGARRILSITTSAYGCYSGCRQYREDTAAALQQLAAGTDGTTGAGFAADAAARVGGCGGAPVTLQVDKTRPFYNLPGMLQANADAIMAAYAQLSAQAIAPAQVRLVLVTHSIPLSMETGSAPKTPLEAQADPASLEPGMTADLATEISYRTQHERFMECLLPELQTRLGLPQLSADLVYCSRSGSPRARWLEPDINDHLMAIAAGHLTDGTSIPIPAGVIVAPIGFIADHMEVVFDLDTEAKATAQQLHLPYVRAATAGTHPAFIASLAEVLLERAAIARGQAVVPVSLTGTGPFHTVCPPACCRPATMPPAASHKPCR